MVHYWGRYHHFNQNPDWKCCIDTLKIYKSNLSEPAVELQNVFQIEKWVNLPPGGRLAAGTTDWLEVETLENTGS